MLIYGENGTGKTHSAKAVWKWIQQIGPSIQFMRRAGFVSYAMGQYWEWPRLLDMLKEGQWHIIEEATEADLLIIDELGGGHDPSFVGVDKLCQLLSARERKWTLITTNIMPDAWEQKFDRRIASRFVRNSELIDLSGLKDYRSRWNERSSRKC